MVLPLSTMTIGEKLSIMESLWEDISQEPANVVSPAWHEEILKAREGSPAQRIPVELNDAKNLVRARLK